MMTEWFIFGLIGVIDIPFARALPDEQSNRGCLEKGALSEMVPGHRGGHAYYGLALVLYVLSS
jgi:hypothetical protein